MVAHFIEQCHFTSTDTHGPFFFYFLRRVQAAYWDCHQCVDYRRISVCHFAVCSQRRLRNLWRTTVPYFNTLDLLVIKKICSVCHQECWETLTGESPSVSCQLLVGFTPYTFSLETIQCDIGRLTGIWWTTLTCLGCKTPAAFFNMVLFEAILSVNTSVAPWSSQRRLLVAPSAEPFPMSQEKV